MKISLNFENYNIEIFNDPIFSPNSTDNKIQYDSVIGETDYKPSSKHGIVVRSDGGIVKSLVILSSGGATGIHENCFVQVDRNIYLCAGDSIYKIEIPELEISWSVKIDDATAFQIKKIHDDFIVHGELAISRLNQAGKIIWQNYGSDIFVSETGEMEFEIRDDLIYARSWDGREYCFNFDGSS